MDLTLSSMPGSYSIVRLEKNVEIPSWATGDSFFSITKTDDELSIVCSDESVPEEVTADRNWRMFKVIGPLDFPLTGVAAAIHKPLSEAKISVFLISTYDTDYIFVKDDRFEEAKEILSEHFTVC
jgi:hypothetical protein